MKPRHHHLWKFLLWALLFISLPVFSTVQSQGQEDSSSPLSNSTIIPLQEEGQIELPLPKDGLPVTFYHWASGFSDYVTTVNCPGREVTIYAKRITIKPFKEQDWLSKIQPLDEKTAKFSSSKGNSASVSVSPRFSEATIISISVYFKETQEEPNKAATFTIFMSHNIKNLSPGVSHEDSVDNHFYGFFSVNIMKPDSSLLISLTSQEGELHLFLGKNARPTTFDNQLAVVSKDKVKVIEIDHTDFDSIAGTWTIGVFGANASSFTIAVVEQDRKIVNLQAGTPPVKMSLEESSSVNLKLLLEGKRHTQLIFTKDSGEFDLYVNSLSKDQDLASSIPGEAHFQLKFSHLDFQSTKNIPLQCPLGFDSCLQLIHIEVKSSGDFSVLVDQEEKFLLVQKGFQYTGMLKPQESVAYLLSAEETLLNIDMQGTGLEVFVSDNPTVNITNYLWKETLSSKKTIQLKDSGKNIPFYVVFYNPTGISLNYSFPTVLASSSTFLIDTEATTVDFLPYDKKSFEYFSNAWTTPIDITIKLAIPVEEVPLESDIRLALRQGQMIRGQVSKGRYWSGKEVTPLAKSEPSARNNATHMLLDCEFSIQDPHPGKYTIEIANLWHFNMRVEVFMSMNPDRENYCLPRMSQNSQEMIEVQERFSKEFDMLMVTPGNWYLWVSNCDSFGTLTIRRNSDWEMKSFDFFGRNGTLYQETIEDKPIEEREDRFKTIIIDSHFFREKKDRIEIYSVVINETEFATYELTEYHPPQMIKASYKYQQNNSEVAAKFSPLKFQKGFKSTDKIRYQVTLLEAQEGEDWREAFCGQSSGVSSSEIELPIDHKEEIRINFSEVLDGKYHVRIKGFVIHESQVIKYFTYSIGHVNVQDLFWWNVLMVFVGIVALVLGVIVWKKYSKKGGEAIEKKGFEAVEAEKDYVRQEDS